MAGEPSPGGRERELNARRARLPHSRSEITMQHAEEWSPDYGAGDIKFETRETPNVAIGSTKSISSPSLLVQDPLPLLQMRFNWEAGIAPESPELCPLDDFYGFFEGSRAASRSFRYACLDALDDSCSRKKALITKHLTEHQTRYRTNLVLSSPRARQARLAEGLQYSLRPLSTHMSLLVKMPTKPDYSYEIIRIAKGSRLSR